MLALKMLLQCSVLFSPALYVVYVVTPVLLLMCVLFILYKYRRSTVKGIIYIHIHREILTFKYGSMQKSVTKSNALFLGDEATSRNTQNKL